MANAPLLTRRFIRHIVVQRLYAFYVCKQANYDGALDQIRKDLIPDIFSDQAVGKAQLAQEQQQATALFTSSADSSRISSLAHMPASSRVNTAVACALTNYQDASAKDVYGLEQGLTDAVVKINQTCIRIWQLLVVWKHIADTQTSRPKLRQQHNTVASANLSHSPLLQRLQNDRRLAEQVRQDNLGWGPHMSLVENWHHQFVKNNAVVQQYLAQPITPKQDRRLLVFLIEDIIFNQEVIQAFLGEVNLYWEAHAYVVRKLMQLGLSQLVKYKEKKLCFPVLILDVAAFRDNAYRFYTDLVHTTFKEDGALEALIAEKAKNWTIDRITLLDKTILKLALCEMLHFSSIPIKVSINEYIDLSKVYGTPKSSQFVNGVLDAVASTLL